MIHGNSDMMLKSGILLSVVDDSLKVWRPRCKASRTSSITYMQYDTYASSIILR